jgi:hypothetical protein
MGVDKSDQLMPYYSLKKIPEVVKETFLLFL